MRTISSVVVAGALILGAGCGFDVEPFGEGSLHVGWEVAPLGCEQSGIDTVQVSLRNNGRSYGGRAECEAGAMAIDGIQPGTYELEIRAWEDGRRPTFGADFGELRIIPDEHRDLRVIDLVALPGVAQVEWYFDNQRVCGANDVDEVEITVFDSALYEVHRATSNCDAAVADVEGLRAGSYLFRARARGGGAIFEGLEEASLKRGDQVDVRIGLTRID